MTNRLDDVLNEIDEFLEDQQDVVDGSYGEQRPNKAMQLLTDLRYARAYPETPRPEGRESIIDECIKACNEEQLHDAIDNEGDRGYFNAVRDCVNALSALKGSAPQDGLPK